MKTLKEICTTYTNGTELPVFDRMLQITAERNCYTQLQKKYRRIADTVYEQYLPVDQSYKNLEELTGDVPRAFHELIAFGIQEVVKDAISVGIHSLDAQTVKSRCMENGYFAPFFDAYHTFTKAVDDMETDLNDSGANLLMNAYVEDGVGTGASLLEHAVNKKWAKQQKEAMFRNHELRENLRRGIWNSCLNLHCYLMDYCSENSSFRMGGYTTDEDIKKAESIHQNLQQLSLSEEQKRTFVLEILELNPYCDAYYLTFVEMFPDREKEFVQLSEYFGTTALCASINKKLHEFVNSQLGTTEEDAYRCRQLLDQRVDDYGMQRTSAASVYRVIDERLAKLDLEYRTEKGIVFETRAAADAARGDLKSYEDILENPPEMIYRTDYTAYIEKIQNLPIGKELITMYVQRYTGKLEQFDKDCRKALRCHYIMQHKKPFWNGDKKDMLLHYGVIGICFFLGIIMTLAKHAPGFLVLAVLILLYLALVKPIFEKKIWKKLTHNGKYDIMKITAGSPVLTEFDSKIQ